MRPGPPRCSTTPPLGPPTSAPSPPTRWWPWLRWLLAGPPGRCGPRCPAPWHGRRHGRPAGRRPRTRGRRPTGGRTGWRRPWYQTRTAVLGAAIVPADGCWWPWSSSPRVGTCSAYLPAAVIALLLPLAALNRGPGGRGLADVADITSLGVVVIVVLGGQRFLDGDGVLPERWVVRLGRPLVRTAALPGALHRHPGRPSGAPTPSTPPCVGSVRRSLPAATWWCSTPSTAAVPSTATPGGRSPTIGSP